MSYWTEFLFVFRSPEAAKAAASEADALGYEARVMRGDGEGRLHQLRLRLDRWIDRPERARLVRAQLIPLIAPHHGSFQGTSAHQEGPRVDRTGEAGIERHT